MHVLKFVAMTFDKQVLLICFFTELLQRCHAKQLQPAKVKIYKIKINSQVSYSDDPILTYHWMMVTLVTKCMMNSGNCLLDSWVIVYIKAPLVMRVPVLISIVAKFRKCISQDSTVSTLNGAASVQNRQHWWRISSTNVFTIIITSGHKH